MTPREAKLIELAGYDPRYLVHLAKAFHPLVKPQERQRPLPPAVPLPVLPACPHLGERVVGGGCGPKVHLCTAYGEWTALHTRCDKAPRHCPTCKHPDNPAAAAEGVSPLIPSDPNTVVIDHGAGGIGDAILGLGVAARLAADRPGVTVRYNCGPLGVPFVQLFDAPRVMVGRHHKAHNESPVAGATHQMNAGYLREQSERYPVSRWQRYAANVGAGGFVLPKLREPARVRALGADCAGAVVLCPFSTDVKRTWSLHHWHTLESLLLRAGYRTVVLHSEGQGLERFQGTKLAGQSADRVAGVMLSAAVVVGCDSGLAHLSGLLGRPTVVLGGHIPVARVFDAYPRMSLLQGPLDCSGCCGHAPADDQCRTFCAALQTISPPQVMRAVDEIVFSDLTEGRSLISADRLAVIRDEVLRTNHLPGDCAELGCFRGGSAKLIRHYATGAVRLFDTFAGIPEDDTAEGGRHVRGEFAGSLEDVQAFVGCDRVAYHVGAFPTGREPDVRYRFVHLDADTFASTRAGLAYFWPRLVSGGVLVLDDVDFVNCPGVRRALSEVLPGVEVETPARHQGVIRKPAG